MHGNGVIGILSESTNKWERRAPLTPSHCARLLHSGKGKSEVSRIVVQPSTKRIHHDALFEDVGCEISEDLSDCGLILGIKQPKLEMILPDRAYAFFSHTHKAQKENMPLLDKILAERASLFDYELIVGDTGKRLLAFGKFAGRAGLIDFLSGLGRRYLSLGYSTPFLSLGSSYMYPSLAAAKAAVVSVGEEIATTGLPSSISPLVFVFTGSGNVSLGAQEIFKLLPHTFVDSSNLPRLFDKGVDLSQSRRAFQVYGCVVTSEDMVEHKDPSEVFDKVDYYAHPERYRPIFHEKVAPYASVIVNCMYWEKRYPRLLTSKQLQDVSQKGSPLVGICDITCDIGGSIEFVNRTTLIDSPLFRYDPFHESYHDDVEGNGVICLAVDILPTEFAKEASQHFGDVLSRFIGNLASTKVLEDLPVHLRRACIAHKGALTNLYEYIPRMQNSESETQHLIALLHSRTIDESHSSADNFLAAILSSRVVEEYIASPTDLAKAYKGSTSGTSQALRQDSKLINNNATCLPKPPMPLLQHPTTMENLPDELLSNIFIRLLAKQLAQMRSVSKSWNGLLSQSSFIQSHLHHSIRNNDQILLVFHDGKSKQFTTHSCRSPHLQLSNFIKLPGNPEPESTDGIRIIGSLNGLICSCYGDSVIQIWNPSLSAVLTLPPYSTPSDDYDMIKTHFRFGYDPKTNDYKVVKLTAFVDNSDVVIWWMDVEIYSMRQGSWRLITERPPSHITWIGEEEVVCVDGLDGHLHWLGCNSEEIDSIVAFALGSETFREIPLPHSLASYKYDHSKSLGVLDGKVYVMAWGENDDAYEVWVMEEYGVAKSWVKRHVFSQFIGDSYPFGFTSANKFLIQDHNNHLVLYNPVTEEAQILKDHSSYDEYDTCEIAEYVDSLVWVAPAKHQMVDGVGQN